MTNHAKPKKKAAKKPEEQVADKPTLEPGKKPEEAVRGMSATEAARLADEAEGKAPGTPPVPGQISPDLLSDELWVRIFTAAAMAGGRRPAEARNLAKDALKNLKKG